MVAKQHERTLQMMENFISLHNEGYSIKEIAKTYNLSEATVYNRLGEIAKKVGVPREELLKKPFIADHSGRNFTPVKPIDKAKFDEGFAMLMAGVNSMQSEIAKAIEDIDTMNNIMEEEIR